MSEKIRTIVLTGVPGVGKTTMVRKICQELSRSNIFCHGFYTEEVREQGIRIGFDVVTLNGTREILARESSSDQLRRPKIGKYSVYLDKFEELALPLLSQQTENYNSLVVLDEVGRMELISSKFEATVNSLIDSTKLFVTVPLSTGRTIPTIERICSSKTSKLFKITKANRNHIKQEIILSINDMMAK